MGILELKMCDNKFSVSEIIPTMLKIIRHKLNGTNYRKWSKTIKVLGINGEGGLLHIFPFLLLLFWSIAKLVIGLIINGIWGEIIHCPFPLCNHCLCFKSLMLSRVLKRALLEGLRFVKMVWRFPTFKLLMIWYCSFLLILGNFNGITILHLCFRIFSGWRLTQ